MGIYRWWTFLKGIFRSWLTLYNVTFSKVRHPFTTLKKCWRCISVEKTPRGHTNGQGCIAQNRGIGSAERWRGVVGLKRGILHKGLCGAGIVCPWDLQLESVMTECITHDHSRQHRIVCTRKIATKLYISMIPKQCRQRNPQWALLKGTHCFVVRCLF